MPDVAVPAPIVDRPWRCRQGHVLGHVRRIDGLWRLVLYPRPLPLDRDLALAVAIVTGSAEVICGECGAVREWHPNAEAMERLLARRRR